MNTTKMTLLASLSLLATHAQAIPIEWAISDGGNGHWYEYVSESAQVDWSAARTLALARTFNGMQGYLVTITSAAENDFAAALKPDLIGGAGEAWIGASDQDVEGEWRWMDGPEAGELFWLGDYSGQSLGYSNWRSGEPNNAGASPGEDWGHIVYGSTSGLWNDRENRPTGGYLVEYSAVNGVPEPPHIALVGLALLGLSRWSRRK